MSAAAGVLIAGAAGAICRYLLDGAIQDRWSGPFPMGTFAINVSGSLALGGLAGFLSHHAAVSQDVRIIVGVGFLGAYTTFSTLAYETLRLAREGARAYALLNMIGSIAAGLGAASLGFWAGGNL